MKKKQIIIIAITLMANFSFGQGLQKGNLLGLHLATVNLKQNVTIDEFKTFFVSKVIPEYEKAWIGLKGYLVKSFKHENSFAIIWLFESEAARNKYFTADDKPNELEKAAYEKVKPIEEELKKYGTYTIAYKDEDDWVVQ
jgi:hypothetical protein